MRYKGNIQDHFDVQPQGSIALVKPTTDWAKEWWSDNVEESSMMGQYFVVEQRYLKEILLGAKEVLET